CSGGSLGDAAEAAPPACPSEAGRPPAGPGGGLVLPSAGRATRAASLGRTRGLPFHSPVVRGTVMARAKIRLDEAADLPPVCVCCGAPATRARQQEFQLDTALSAAISVTAAALGAL